MSEIVVDIGTRLVRRDGQEIHLAPKAFELLVMLVTHQPNAVSHRHLHEALWPGVHVSETSLAALITQLRKALGDRSGDGPTIRTVHRVGYAFVGDGVLAPAAESVATPACRLIWRGATFDVPGGVSVIGRDRGCAVQIDAESISRQHARLGVSGRTVTIEDLGSKNGTWVASERITGRVALQDGLSFRLGSEIVRIEIGTDVRPTKTAIGPLSPDPL